MYSASLFIISNFYVALNFNFCLYIKKVYMPNLLALYTFLFYYFPFPVCFSSEHLFLDTYSESITVYLLLNLLKGWKHYPWRFSHPSHNNVYQNIIIKFLRHSVILNFSMFSTSMIKRSVMKCILISWIHLIVYLKRTIIVHDNDNTTLLSVIVKVSIAVKI